VIQCFLCGEMEHFQSKCPNAKSKKGSEKQPDKEADTVLMTVEESKQPHDDVWIADIATSSHTTNFEVRLFDVKMIGKPVKIGNGKLVYAMKVGKLRVQYTKNDEEQTDFILENVQYILDFWVNLFSLMATMSKGSHISNKERAIVVEKDALCLVFNEEIKTKNGYVCGIILAVKLDDNYCFAIIREGSKQDINLHKNLDMHP